MRVEKERKQMGQVCEGAMLSTTRGLDKLDGEQQLLEEKFHRVQLS